METLHRRPLKKNARKKCKTRRTELVLPQLQLQYDEVWRTGANEATTITFTQDVTIEGQNLPKGTYSLFTIPTAEQWTIIFNVNETQWGAFKYDQSEDALRVNVKPTMVETVQENLLFEVIPDAIPNTGIVRLKWEKLQVDFHFVNAAE